MKTLKKITLSFSVLFLFFLFGCGNDDSGPSITSIQVSVSTDVATVGEIVTLGAKNQEGLDITELVAFYVDDVEIDGNEFTAAQSGSFSITAKFGSIVSSSVSISSIEEIQSIVIEVNKSIIKPTGEDFAVFTARNQSGNDITTIVKFYKDGVLNLNGGNQFSSLSIEEFGVTAKFDETESNEITISSELTITSLTLETNQTSIPADSYSKALLKALDQDSDDVSSFVSFYANEVLLNENTFKSGASGSYQVKASYASVESNQLTVTVEPFVVRKVLIEEFTGEWCGWCPQAAYNLDELVKEHPYVLTVGIHNGDGLEYQNESVLRSAFGLDYFPSGLVGRVNLGSNVGFNGPTLDSRVLGEVNNQIYGSEVLAGVGINSSFAANEATVDIDVSFYQDISDEVRVTIYLIENNVVSGSQQNYFSGRAGYEDAYYYSLPSVISNYNHQYVLRKAATDILGEEIPQENIAAGNVYSLDTKTIDISGYDPANCYVIAFAHYSLGGNKEIINAQQVKLGESIGASK